VFYTCEIYRKQTVSLARTLVILQCFIPVKSTGSRLCLMPGLLWFCRVLYLWNLQEADWVFWFCSVLYLWNLQEADCISCPDSCHSALFYTCEIYRSLTESCDSAVFYTCEIYRKQTASLARTLVILQCFIPVKSTGGWLIFVILQCFIPVKSTGIRLRLSCPDYVVLSGCIYLTRLSRGRVNLPNSDSAC
jgi:hypothetical protein